MRFGRKTSFAAGAIAALVLGSGTAFAATGGHLILGHSNSAGATTTLSNANGAAMNFNSKAGYPSIRVNRTTKVRNLNADLLDGLDSSRFARSSSRTGNVWDQGFYADDNNDGTVDAIEGYVQCPAGTVVTGGGGEDNNPGGALVWSEGAGNGWGIKVSTPPPAGAVVNAPVASVQVTATCINLHGGGVSGSDPNRHMN